MEAKINHFNAKIMANAANELYKKLDELGKTAVRNISLLIPPSEKLEDMYIEFPNNHAITVTSPFSCETVGVHRIYLDENYNVCLDWYSIKTAPCKGGFVILDNYGAVDCINLLNSILIHYGR